MWQCEQERAAGAHTRVCFNKKRRIGTLGANYDIHGKGASRELLLRRPWFSVSTYRTRWSHEVLGARESAVVMSAETAIV